MFDPQALGRARQTSNALRRINEQVAKVLSSLEDGSLEGARASVREAQVSFEASEDPPSQRHGPWLEQGRAAMNCG